MKSVPIFSSILWLSVASFPAFSDDATCNRAWMDSDNDRNGVIDKGEEVALKTSVPVELRDRVVSAMTRDQFLTLCTGRAVSETTPNTKPDPNAETKGNSSGPKDFPKDFGKGDLTPGKANLSEADAQKRIEALGYSDVKDLKLDSDGIWRGTANASGGRKEVAIDPQGDVVSK